MKYSLSVVALLFVFTFFTQDAHALSCIVPPDSMLERGGVIFLGTVDDVHISSKREEEYVRFSVIRSWKGDVSQTVDVYGIRAWTGLLEGSLFYTKGSTYVVFANFYPERNQLHGNIDCSSTKRVEDVKNDEIIKALDKEKGFETPTTPPVFLFARNLTLGSTGADVVALQDLLEARSFLVMPMGVPKGYFGKLTRSALARYQATEGIMPAYGYFGPLTRAHMQ